MCGPASSPQRLELVLQCDGFVKLLRVRNFKLGNHLQDITYYITWRTQSHKLSLNINMQYAF